MLNRLEPVFAPVLVLGGGPAGVVELPNMFVVGLLVGVVVFWLSALIFSRDDVLEGKVLKKPEVLPPPLVPPKRLGA